MKCVIKRTTLVAVFVAVFALGTVSRAQAQDCKNATLNGNFGYTSAGVLLPVYAQHFAGPFAEIGLQTFDGSGGTFCNRHFERKRQHPKGDHSGHIYGQFRLYRLHDAQRVSLGGDCTRRLCDRQQRARASSHCDRVGRD